MKLVWHIIKKDLVRLRLALSVWLLLVVLQIGIGFALLTGDGIDLNRLVHLQVMAYVLVALQFVAGYFLVTRLVHEDGLVGTEVAWRVRPIAGWRLLAAKVLGAGVMFGLLPLFIMLPWWLVCGFGAREIWQAAAIALGWQVPMIVAGLWFASLTNSLGRLMLLTLVAVAWLLAMALQLAATTRLDVPLELVMTRWWLALAAGVLLGTGVTVHQYLTRRVVRAWVMTVASLGLIGLVLQFWPWTWAEMTRKADPFSATEESELTQGISVTQQTAQIETRFTKDGSVWVTTRFWLQGVPESMGVNGLKVRHHWRWPGMKGIFREAPLYVGHAGSWESDLRKTWALAEPEKDAETERYWEGLSKEKNWRRPDPAFRDTVMLQSVTVLPASMAERMQAEPPVHTAALAAVLTRGEAVAELSLSDRSRKYYRSQTLRITQVIPGNDHATALSIVATMPVRRTERLQSWQRSVERLRLDTDTRPQAIALNGTAFAVSRATGEFRHFFSKAIASAQICGVRVSWGTVETSGPNVRRGEKWVPRYENWTSGVTLCIIETQAVERFTREVTVERLILTNSREGHSTD